MQNELFSKNGFELTPREQELFDKYLELFVEYNNHTNLSAIRDEPGIIEKHFVDSLMSAPYISEILALGKNTKKLLDIGSGGGFPGIPLKIACPELDVTLLDSVGKKVKAMNFFVEQLGLQHIVAIQERAEIIAKKPEHREQYDFVVSRATAYITDILTWAKPFLTPNGKIILYKMPSEDEKKDIIKITKKLSLHLSGEIKYTLGDKERIIYIFGK